MQRLLRGSNSRITSRPKRITLGRLLIIPFAVQVGFAVALSGYFTFRDGRESVQQVSARLRTEITESTLQKINAYLSQPVLINQINAEILRSKELQLNSRKSEYHLWHQLNLFPSVRWVYFGDAATGGHIVARRTLQGNLEVGGANSSNLNMPHFYQMSNQGDRLGLTEKTNQKYDARTRPWFRSAVTNQGTAWTSYVGFSSKKLTLTASQAVYDRSSNKLLGVLAVDLFVEDIGKFLSTMNTGSGQIFIVDGAGQLVANSGSVQPFVKKADGTLVQIQAKDSQAPLIRSAMQTLNANNASFDLKKISQAQSLFEFEQNGKRQYAQISTIQEVKGAPSLDWYIVTVLPESDIVGDMQAGTQRTIILCFVTTGLAIAIGGWTTYKLVKPIKNLTETATAIAEGNFDHNITGSKVKELDVLAQAFNSMTEDLKQSVQALEARNEDLEAKVAERTEALQDSNQALETLNEELEVRVAQRGQDLAKVARTLQVFQSETMHKAIQREKVILVGQFVASIIRGINTPIQSVYGNTQYLYRDMQRLLELIALYDQTFTEIPAEIQLKRQIIDIDSLSENVLSTLHQMTVDATEIRAVARSLQNLTGETEEDKTEPIDINQIIDSMILIVKPQLNPHQGRAAIVIIKDYYDGLPQINGNSDEISRIFLALIMNAVDAINERWQSNVGSDSAPEIKISTRYVETAEGTEIRVQVSDNGTGMNQEMVETIFDPFIRSNPFEKGSGLSLYMSHATITDIYQGSLTCNSVLGCGSEFTVAIPIS
jgi:signal transduction histidine kinase/HAMP domain-containing protein